MTQYVTTKGTWGSERSHQGFGSGFRRFIETARTYLAAHGNAREAEDLYQYLSGMSDEELGRRGINRADIPDLVRTHVLSDGGGS